MTAEAAPARRSGPLPLGTGPLAGIVGGLAVGAFDGLHAQSGLRGQTADVLVAIALCAGLDALAGGVAGIVVEAGLRCARWGRRARPGLPAGVLGWLVSAIVTGASACGVFAATAERNNRFLAAGLVALAACVAGFVTFLLAPAVARGLSLRRSTAGPASWPEASALPLVVAVAWLGGAAVFVLAWKARVPLDSRDLGASLALLGVAAAAIPIALAIATGAKLPFRTPCVALPVAAVLAAVPAALILAEFWEDHLYFAPWHDLGVAGAVLLIGLAFAGVARRRLASISPLRRGVALLLLWVVSLVATASASEVEEARKGAARAGLAPAVLAWAQWVMDLDGDGYPPLLGGGDCDESDASVHPGADDWPLDQIDQDCDGRDPKAKTLRSKRYVDVPASVPTALNFLLITIDTIRADHLGCYGYERPTSPELDRLASEGALFENGWAHAPSTRFSMPALVTGRWPSAIEWEPCVGCRSWWPRIGPRVRTLPEAMSEQGYFTAALFNYAYFARSEQRGFERGIEHFDDRRSALHVNVRGPMESRGSSARQMADDAISLLERSKNRKFFLWVHFYDPHLSYELHPEVPPFGSSRIDRYDGEIRFTDMHVGRILARLRQLGLYDRTAIVVTGDHGEGFGEHGVTEHGYDLYAPQTKVPFIVRVPGLGPHREGSPVGHVDLAPTIVNLSRGNHEPSFLGRSLVDLLAGAPRGRPREVFQEVTSERGMKRALVSDSHHLLWNVGPAGTTECYDLSRDREEKRDLWGRHPRPPQCGKLLRQLKGWAEAVSFPPDFRQKLAWGLFRPGHRAPTPEHRVEGRIGDAVRVLGWDGPEFARPGEEVTIAIHYEALRPVDAGWRLFTHLMGTSMRNLDHVPVEGTYPLERWRPGQRIRDRIRLVFPAAGRMRYAIAVGIYRGRERLAVSPEHLNDGKDALLVGSIMVR